MSLLPSCTRILSRWASCTRISSSSSGTVVEAWPCGWKRGGGTLLALPRFTDSLHFLTPDTDTSKRFKPSVIWLVPKRLGWAFGLCGHDFRLAILTETRTEPAAEGCTAFAASTDRDFAPALTHLANLRGRYSKSAMCAALVALPSDTGYLFARQSSSVVSSSRVNGRVLPGSKGLGVGSFCLRLASTIRFDECAPVSWIPKGVPRIRSLADDVGIVNTADVQGRRDLDFTQEANRRGRHEGLDPNTSKFTGGLGYEQKNVAADANPKDSTKQATFLTDLHKQSDGKFLDGIDWDNLGFGLRPTDFMFIMKCEQNGEWGTGELHPYGNLELSPSAAVLNYGQGLFEGLKAYRTRDGRILLFRPEENALRLISGADRLSMPAVPVDKFVNAVTQTVLANKRWVPPPGKGSLYIRPLLIGSGAVLGLAPAPEYTFVIYVSPVGNYFKSGLVPIDLKVDTYYHRAAPGGTGGVKTIGNYASVLKTQLAAKGNGYSDVLYLDAVENKYVEEVKMTVLANMMPMFSHHFRKSDRIVDFSFASGITYVHSLELTKSVGGVVSTPELQGTILPGITRKSIVELARNIGFEVQERPVDVEELLEADEVFCTGTAVVVNPVGSVTYNDKRVKYKNTGFGAVSQELYIALTNIQLGLAEDKMGWVVQL